ncbi:hypothetical protein [Kitasatospora sp. NPDC094015]|uniref:hypothetical protein n=1 Tax=Kitasatospora sp. NPDC094015 TaxID=3155205 RepID=UPI003321E44F
MSEAGRYEVIQLPADGRGRELWAVLDRVAGLWAESEEGEVLTFGIRETAQGHAARLRYLGETAVLGA